MFQVLFVSSSASDPVGLYTSRVRVNFTVILFITTLSFHRRDFYQILGVNRDATSKQIKKAYRTLAMKYHPDKNKDDPDAQTKFHDINEAYEVIRGCDQSRDYHVIGTQRRGKERHL